MAEQPSEFTSNRSPADKVRTEIFVLKYLSLHQHFSTLHFALFYEVLLIQCVTDELILQAGSAMRHTVSSLWQLLVKGAYLIWSKLLLTELCEVGQTFQKLVFYFKIIENCVLRSLILLPFLNFASWSPNCLLLGLILFWWYFRVLFKDIKILYDLDCVLVL